MSIKTRFLGVGASAAAVALTIVAVGTIGDHFAVAQSQLVPSNSDAGTATTVDQAGSTSSREAPPLDPSTVDALASDGLVAETTDSKPPRISLDRAGQQARSEFPGMLTDESPLVEASTMSVTIPEYGKQLQADPNKTSEILPAIDHRLAWLLIFDNVDVPLMGSFNEDEMKSLPTPAPSRFVVLIDGESGSFLHARTF